MLAFMPSVMLVISCRRLLAVSYTHLLINRLLNRKGLARTSATPGKTATVNFYRLDRARLVDLPGYGYAKVSSCLLYTSFMTAENAVKYGLVDKVIDKR